MLKSFQIDMKIMNILLILCVMVGMIGCSQESDNRAESNKELLCYLSMLGDAKIIVKNNSDQRIAISGKDTRCPDIEWRFSSNVLRSLNTGRKRTVFIVEPRTSKSYPIKTSYLFSKTKEKVSDITVCASIGSGIESYNGIDPRLSLTNVNGDIFLYDVHNKELVARCITNKIYSNEIELSDSVADKLNLCYLDTDKLLKESLRQIEGERAKKWGGIKAKDKHLEPTNAPTAGK